MGSPATLIGLTAAGCCMVMPGLACGRYRDFQFVSRGGGSRSRSGCSHPGDYLSRDWTLGLAGTPAGIESQPRG